MGGRRSRLTSSITRASVSACRTAALYRWEFEKGGQTAQIDVSGPITLDEASLARTAVLEGVGLGFFMEQDVRADIEAGRLVRVLEDSTPSRRFARAQQLLLPIRGAATGPLGPPWLRRPIGKLARPRTPGSQHQDR